MTVWAIQSNGLRYSEQLETVEAITAAGLKWVEISMYPFQDELIGIENLPDDEPVIFTGSTKLVDLVYKNKKWNPGVFFDSDLFNVKVWSKHRSDMLNTPHVMTFKQLEAWWMANRPRDKFIRPLLDLKAFSGKLMNDDEFFGWYDYTTAAINNDPRFDLDIEVAVCDPVNLAYEWRFFVVGGKIVSGSQYMKGTQLESKVVSQDDEVWAVAQRKASGWLPNDVVVMDICQTKAGEFKVIEFNCFNGSGFYDNDKQTIFKAVTEYVDNGECND